MVRLLKLNGISFLYAYIYFLVTELHMNTVRIYRVLPFLPTQFYSVLSLILLGLFAVWIRALTQKILPTPIRYASVFLWLPYAAIMVVAFARMFPFSSQEIPLGAFGLLLVGWTVLFFVYILVINRLAKPTG